MVEMALAWDGPVYLRMKRPDTTPAAFTPQKLEIGKGVIRRDGSDITIISAGICVSEALKAAEDLSKDGIQARVIDMASIKPIDEHLIIESAQKTGAIITVENHSIIGGLGSAVAETLMEAGIGLPFTRVGIQDQFCEGGTTAYLMNKFGIDCKGTLKATRNIFDRK